MKQLGELAKQRPRGKTDENLMSEVSRLESTMTVARDDLVSRNIFLPFITNNLGRLLVSCV